LEVSGKTISFAPRAARLVGGVEDQSDGAVGRIRLVFDLHLRRGGEIGADHRSISPWPIMEGATGTETSNPGTRNTVERMTMHEISGAHGADSSHDPMDHWHEPTDTFKRAGSLNTCSRVLYDKRDLQDYRDMLCAGRAAKARFPSG
jgi:hypothetical protein